MIQEFNSISKVQGELELPGDKSISHRALFFSSMAEGESRIYNLSNSDDVKSTQECFEALGVKIIIENDDFIVTGKGYNNFDAPIKPLYAGNSATTARLLTGLLMTQKFQSLVTGDYSLSKRPMGRVIEPLTRMGARISASENETLPLTVRSAKEIKPATYELPVASAQVKSSILIAGLHLDEETSVVEKFQSRNHTEKMLGLKVERNGNGIISYSSKKNYPEAKEYSVPADVSTAAFFIVLTLLSQNSSLTLKNVSLNETRTGYLKILKEMGGYIKIDNKQEKAGEEYGDIFVKSSELKNIKISEDIIPNIIDEVPILAIAGIFAEGDFEINNISELRSKETDRIKAICENLKLVGLDIDEKEAGFMISGELGNNKVEFESYDDHRIAMTFAVLSMLLENGSKVNGFDCVKISNPGFLRQLRKVTI
ncbi:MAG: 3-phosphoshikimate 1-carboxyvinyltransferase [Ignavibacteriaceae bacterium]